MSRRGKLDQMLWGTVRFPALVPQVWLNWLNAVSEEESKLLEDYPSRVDFVGFWKGQRHVVEIDGPSHYATYDEKWHMYNVDERGVREEPAVRSVIPAGRLEADPDREGGGQGRHGQRRHTVRDA